MTRYKASLIHICGSALILFSILGFIILRFYPGFYFQAEGGWSATKILILVDLVLGPLLTLVVFKTGKKGLKFDLIIIALLQVTALSYGSYILYSERPAYLVFAIDRFEIATAADVDYSGNVNKDFSVGPLSRPRVVFAHNPENADNKQLNKHMEEGKDLYLLSQYYDDFPSNISKASPKKLDSSEFLITAEDHLLLTAFLAKFGGSKEDYYYFPLIGNSKIMLAAINPSTGELVTVLGINPWRDPI